MSWFKVDDAFHSSKPVLKIPRKYRLAAVGLWISAGTWCAQEESDGFLPEWVLEELCGTPALARQLVNCDLWSPVTRPVLTSSSVSERSSSGSEESGWQFKNWSKYQPTRKELDEKREKDRIRQANYRASLRDNGVTPKGQTEGQHHESDPPDPTRPDPNTEAKASVPRKRGRRIPNDFAITEEMRAWGRENCPTVNGTEETVKFINYWQAKSGRDATKLDWEATWRNWMLNAKERQPTVRANPTEKAQSIMQMGRELQEGVWHGFDGNQPALGEGGFGGQPAGDEGGYRGLGRASA